VTDDDSTNSMLQFQLERESDGMKHYQKVKQKQRARLGSIKRKHDTTQRRGNINRRSDSTGEAKGRRQYELE
jgi:hypothetical protein